MEHSFLFFDIETSGLNESFDQIVQFAGIRTDTGLNILETHDITVRLRPDIVPTPKAQITHRIPIKKLMSEGISEYDAVKKIHRILNTPGTTAIGYNNMRFDGPMLRFSFHRNLLHPYTHQYQNGCSQMDALPMLISCKQIAPDLLRWPSIDGNNSFKLSLIAKENGLLDFNETAHNALSDAKMLLKIVRVLKSKEDLWDYLCGFFKPQTDKDRLSRLPVVCKSKIHGMSPIEHSLGVILSPKYANANCQASVLFLGNSIPYPKQGLWLKIDYADFQDLTSVNFPDRAIVIRKKIGGADFILPPEGPFCSLPPERLGLSEKNLKWILEQPELFSDMVRYFREFRFPSPSDLDPDTALYGMPFLSDRDQYTHNLFHETDSVEKKAGIIFTRPAYGVLAKRIIWRNFDTPIGVCCDFFNYMKKKNVFDYKGRIKMSADAALEKISLLRAGVAMDGEQLALLAELESYIKNTVLKALTLGGNDLELGELKREIPGISCSFEWLLKKYWRIVAWFLDRRKTSVAVTGVKAAA